MSRPCKKTLIRCTTTTHFGRHFIYLRIDWTKFLWHVNIEMSSVHSDPPALTSLLAAAFRCHPSHPSLSLSCGFASGFWRPTGGRMRIEEEMVVKEEGKSGPGNQASRQKQEAATNAGCSRLALCPFLPRAMCLIKCVWVLASLPLLIGTPTIVSLHGRFPGKVAFHLHGRVIFLHYEWY